MLAEITQTNWEVIIAAIGVIAVQLFAMWISYLRSQASAKREKEQADRDQKQVEAIKDVKEAQDIQHLQTNSKLDKYVAEMKKAATAEGNLSGRKELLAEQAFERAAIDRAEEKDKEKG